MHKNTLLFNNARVLHNKAWLLKNKAGLLYSESRFDRKRGGRCDTFPPFGDFNTPKVFSVTPRVIFVSPKVLTRLS